MESESYFVRIRGRVSGPYDRSQIREMLEHGKLASIHQISTDKSSWHSVRDFQTESSRVSHGIPEPTGDVQQESFQEGDQKSESYGSDAKNCPACGETIKAEAKKCRFCGERFDMELPNYNVLSQLSEGDVVKPIQGQVDMRSCPNCGAVSPQSAAICVTCGFDYRYGRQIAAHTISSPIHLDNVVEQNSYARGRPVSVQAGQWERQHLTVGLEGIGLIVGSLGFVVAALGCFAPFASVPIFGSITYYNGGKGDGVKVLVFAGIGLLMTVGRWLIPMLVNAVLCVGICAYDVYIFISGKLEAIDTAREEMQTELADNPFARLGELMAEGLIGSVTLQWGAVLILIGGLAAVMGAVIAIKGRD